MIAESTCSSIFSAAPRPDGKALLGYMELTQIALERSSTAREAIDLMGSLAVEHGFYGNGLGLAGAAESLAVADSMEAWVFHILPDDTGTSAIWAAQRVPDGEATVVANMFIIREMALDNPDCFRFSQTALEVATKLKLWAPGEPFDFTLIYSAGEARNQYYSGRRMWRGMSLMSPSAALAPHYDDLVKAPAYPFSVLPDQPLSRHCMFSIMRDTYQGTDFDLSSQPASGPFHIADRYDGHETTRSTFERPIGTHRMKYSYVCEHPSAIQDPVLWFGEHVSVTSVYLPILQSMRRVPDPLARGWMKNVDRVSAYWAFRYVKHLSLMCWDRCLPMIIDRQSSWERKAARIIEEEPPGEAKEAALHALAAQVVTDWWEFADELMSRYGDGYDYDGIGLDGGTPLCYPASWLQHCDVQSSAPPAAISWTVEKKRAEFKNEGRNQAELKRKYENHG